MSVISMSLPVELSWQYLWDNSTLSNRYLLQANKMRIEILILSKRFASIYRELMQLQLTFNCKLSISQKKCGSRSRWSSFRVSAHYRFPWPFWLRNGFDSINSFVIFYPRPDTDCLGSGLTPALCRLVSPQALPILENDKPTSPDHKSTSPTGLTPSASSRAEVDRLGRKDRRIQSSRIAESYNRPYTSTTSTSSYSGRSASGKWTFFSSNSVALERVIDLPF